MIQPLNPQTGFNVNSIQRRIQPLIKISSESDQNNEKCNIGEIFSSRSESDINLRDPNLEVKLIKENINLIAEYQKEISDQNEHVCCSCRRLLRRKNVTKVNELDKRVKFGKN